MMPLFDTINMWSAFAAVAINLVFVILILARTSRTATYRLFLLTFAGVIIWNFGIFLQYYSRRGVWFYLAIIGSPMIPAFLFHLTRTLIKRPSGGIWLAVAYGLAGALALSSFLAVYSPLVKRFVDSAYWNICFLLFLIPFVVVSMFMMFKIIRAPLPGIETNQIKYIFYATIIGTGMGLTDLVQIFGIQVPKLGHAGSVVFSSIIAIGIFKYRKSYDILVQMRNKFELLSEVASGISHEIRNPLSSIRGAVNLLATEVPRGTPSADMREYVDIIQEEIVRLDSILGNFQQLTKPLSISKEPVSINDILLRTVRLADAGVTSLSISVDLAPDLPPVKADASLLKQVFLNLIKNAGETCIANGELTINTARVPHGVSIVFRDNGAGIPSDLLDSIFEPFFTTKRTGMGMGLTISRRLIEAHEGRLNAESSGSGGATFTVFLPA
jgi:signal transduction histidine kinase